jgi:hypothetical protein
MNRKPRSCARRQFVFIAISLITLVSITTAAPDGEANPFERLAFGDDWGILDNEIFFGGANGIFGLSPASRTLMLVASESKKNWAGGIVNAADSNDEFSFSAFFGSPLGSRGGGGGAPGVNAPTPPDYYWDTNGATPGTGGTGTWNFIDANWNEATGATVPGLWANGNVAHFAGVPGVVSVNGTVVPTSAAFETTGYTLQTVNPTDTVNGPIVLGPAVTLLVHNPTVTGANNRTLEVGGNISGGVGSGITIQGAQTGGNHSRIVLTVANSVISVPITIVKTGAGSGGIVGNAAGQQVTGSITNNSLGATLLGAGTGGSLTVSGPITGTAGLRLSSAASGNSGAGTVGLTGNNTFTGATVVSTAASGIAVLGSTSGQALGGTSSVAVNSGTLRWDVSNQINNTAGVTLGGGTLALNGFSEGAPGTNGVGALTLTANSIISFATGVTNSIIQFAGIGAHIPTTGADLLITNWNGDANMGGGPERLLFSGNTADFTTQYSQSDVSFNGMTGYNIYQFGGFYEVTAVPEPSTWVGAALALAAIGFTQRRRLRSLLAHRTI